MWIGFAFGLSKIAQCYNPVLRRCDHASLAHKYDKIMQKSNLHQNGFASHDDLCRLFLAQQIGHVPWLLFCIVVDDC